MGFQQEQEQKKPKKTLWKHIERSGHYDAQKGQRDRGDRASFKFIHDLNTLLWHACPGTWSNRNYASVILKSFQSHGDLQSCACIRGIWRPWSSPHLVPCLLFYGSVVTFCNSRDAESCLGSRLVGTCIIWLQAANSTWAQRGTPRSRAETRKRECYRVYDDLGPGMW